MARDEINPVDVLRELGMKPLHPPETILGGQDTSIWRFATADGSDHALRLFRPGHGGGYLREQIALRAAHEAGIPTPDLEAEGLYEGRRAMVISWCAGRPLISSLEKQPWQAGKMGRMLGRAHAALHRLPAPEALREEAPGYWLNRSDDSELVERLLSRGISTSTFVHLDFHPLNVLAGDNEVTCVIDWVNAAAGDPRADFALTISLLSAAPAPAGPMKALVNFIRGRLVAAYRKGYSESGVMPAEDELAPFYAWAGSVMLTEMEPRVREGRVSAGDLEPIRRWLARWQAYL
ncbi:MAG: aminoglycoside phosphotransferase family protein [Dehalococcoidia bacterium]